MFFNQLNPLAGSAVREREEVREVHGKRKGREEEEGTVEFVLFKFAIFFEQTILTMFYFRHWFCDIRIIRIPWGGQTVLLDSFQSDSAWTYWTPLRLDLTVTGTPCGIDASEEHH